MIGCADAAAGCISQRRVVAASAVRERGITNGRVLDAGGIEKERKNTNDRIPAAGGGAMERPVTNGRVLEAFGVEIERTMTVGRVVAAAGVAKEGDDFRDLASNLFCKFCSFCLIHFSTTARSAGLFSSTLSLTFWIYEACFDCFLTWCIDLSLPSVKGSVEINPLCKCS